MCNNRKVLRVRLKLSHLFSLSSERSEQGEGIKRVRLNLNAARILNAPVRMNTGPVNKT